MPMVCIGQMNVEAIPKQGKASIGVLTVKLVKGMLHKLFSITTALFHEWKIYGTKKENGDIEIKLSHEHFEPIVFDQVLRFDDTILLAAKIKILPKNLNQEGAHTATLEGKMSKKMLHQVTGHAGKCYRGGAKCFCCSLEKIRQKNICKKKMKIPVKTQERECILIYYQ